MDSCRVEWMGGGYNALECLTRKGFTMANDKDKAGMDKNDPKFKESITPEPTTPVNPKEDTAVATLEYPDTFPEQELSTVLGVLRGGGDVKAAVHSAWVIEGYALKELVGTPDNPTPVPAGLAVAPAVHFGPVTKESCANQLQQCCDEHKKAKAGGGSAAMATANGQWLAKILPIIWQVLQMFLKTPVA